ncbi:hypothetical protein F511_43558 [Dorcoceras hygrometricum]|uniref:Uncharacterized protein n=1 Tax=Dorcoceras hygrometricum TaxID=472368 RepID=A0A2Z6ZYH2_9LAMI|nr:hypothetical protein F511_43558 [Dorcoceras hygrometricum]
MLEKLQVLGVGDNFFVGSIPSSIFNISSLQYINISQCNLTGPFPSGMCSPLSQLERVYFHKNEIVGQLPESIGYCSKLQILSSYDNNITGSIPKGIGNLTML